MKLPEFLRPQVTTTKVDQKFKLKQLVLIGSILVASIVITNVIGVKVMTLFGVNFTAGVITYGIVFLCTDVIGEIWGKRTGYYIILLGFLANLFLLLFVQVAIWSTPASFWEENQTAYAATLGGVSRIVFASMVAYLFSQIHDVWAFDFWRRKFKGRLLIVRNNFSTITSQLLDSLIFLSIAFLPILPLADVLSMLWGQVIIKWAIALLDTPLILLAVKLLGSPVEGAHPSK